VIFPNMDVINGRERVNSRISNSGPGFEKKGGSLRKDMKHVNNTVPQILCPWLFSVFCITLQLIEEIFGDLYAETSILQSQKSYFGA